MKTPGFAEVQRRQFMEAAAQVQSQTDRSTRNPPHDQVAQANAEQWREAVEDAIKRIPDWTEVVSKSTARTTPEMEDAIKERVRPRDRLLPRQASWEAERIYNLSPRRRIAKSSGWKPEIRKRSANRTRNQAQRNTSHQSDLIVFDSEAL